MNRKTVSLLGLIISVGMYGQESKVSHTYPQKDADGQTIYYKILTAKSGYVRSCYCLQDESNTAGNNFQYTLGVADGTNRRQEWILVAVDTASETYYLRNRQTYRYLSVSGKWTEGLFAPVYSRTADGNEITVTRIADGGGQVTLTYGNGDDNGYFAATETSGGEVANPLSLSDTDRAWLILRSEDVSLGIDEATGAMDSPQYYDMSGRRVPASRTDMHGVYIIKRSDKIHKVLK